VDIHGQSKDIPGISTLMDLEGISMDIPCICRKSTYTGYVPGIFQIYSKNRGSRCALDIEETFNIGYGKVPDVT
jgi:hypothetical protein